METLNKTKEKQMTNANYQRWTMWRKTDSKKEIAKEKVFEQQNIKTIRTSPWRHKTNEEKRVVLEIST